MRKITKIVGLGSVVAVAGTIGWHALAQSPGSGPPFMHGMGPGMRMGMGAGPMLRGFGDPAKLLASLKVELAITPAEQAAWDAYAKTVTETAASMKAQHQSASIWARCTQCQTRNAKPSSTSVRSKGRRLIRP